MKKIIWAIVLIIILFLVIAVVSKNPGPVTNKTIKIGAPLVLSGESAKYGKTAKNGIDMAIETYNNKTEVTQGSLPKIEVIYEDTHADPKTAVSAYQKLVKLDKVNVLLGPLFQTEMSALTPLVKQDNIPVIAIAPIPIDQRGSTSNPLVVWPDPTLEAQRLARYVYDQGIRTVSVLGTKDAWESEVSNSFADEFKSIGGSVVDMELTLADSKDTSLPVSKAIAAHSDAIYLGTYFKFEYYIKKLKELGYKGKIYSIEVDSYLADVTNPYSNNVEFISPAYFDPDFANLYKNKYNEDPSIPAGQAFDAANLFLQVAMVPGVFSSDPGIFNKNILNKLEHVTEYSGVSGTIMFTPEHRATFPLSIYRVNDGKITKIK